jgi:hypothetical protein
MDAMETIDQPNVLGRMTRPEVQVWGSVALLKKIKDGTDCLQDTSTCTFRPQSVQMTAGIATWQLLLQKAAATSDIDELRRWFLFDLWIEFYASLVESTSSLPTNPGTIAKPVKPAIAPEPIDELL